MSSRLPADPGSISEPCDAVSVQQTREKAPTSSPASGWQGFYVSTRKSACGMDFVFFVFVLLLYLNENVFIGSDI